MYSKEQIEEFISDLIIEPRINAVKWSKITNQSANIRIGYPGQHLASLVTGVKGEGSGARGNDLEDGSEVKSCSRVDQLDKCKNCGSPVLRQEEKCSNCDSTNIDRKNDSKWLFTIRSEDDLKTLVDNENLDRVVLIIDDYPKFDSNDFKDIRIQIFEIYPKLERHKRFKEIMTNYYYKIYSEQKRLYPNKTPAPKNFWPFQYQFYLCNPIKIFEAIISNAYTENPSLEIKKYVEPTVDRTSLASMNMPPEVLNIDELKKLILNVPENELVRNLKEPTSYSHLKILLDRKSTKAKDLALYFNNINESLRNYLELRDTDKIAVAKNSYQRRINTN